MRELLYFTKRNCLVYLRDRSAVFFSMLSMFIVLGLMILFLGNMNIEAVTGLIEEYKNRAVTAEETKNVTALVQMWTVAGILVVNSVTVTLTVLGSMVEDETRKKIMAFYVTPVKRRFLALGYILSAWIIGFFMCLLTLVAAEVYFTVKGYELLSAISLVKLAGMILCNTFTFSAVGYLLALFVHSEKAWSGMLTIIGTLVGFVGGIYLPVSQLTKNIQNIVKALPVLHGASMMREISTKSLLDKTFAGMPEKFITAYKEEMGITVTIGGHMMDIRGQVLFLLGYACIAVIFAAIITRNRKLKDR